MHKNDSPTQKYNSTSNNPHEDSKTFPMIPDQIHKVPESIRKAIKIGKHRKNINVSNNINQIPKFTSEILEDSPDLQKQKQSKIEKKQSGIQVRQIFNFGSRALEEEEQERVLDPDTQFKEVVPSRFLKNNNKVIGGDRILYAVKKLSPIKKGLTVEPRSIVSRDKRFFKVTFLNVQKLQLVNMYSNQKSKDIIEHNRTAANLASSIATKSSLIENFLQSTGLSQNSSNLRKSFYDKSPTKIRLKPFAPPFQKYYYRDFIWKCAFSFSIFHESPEAYEQKFKVFIGGGNNSMLIKSLFKKRKSWWVLTDRYDEANFIWTQIKINAIFHTQKTQKSIYQEPQQFCPQEASKISRKQNGGQKQNLRILSEHEYFHWSEYFNKFRRAEDLLDETMKKRNRIFCNDKNTKFTCSNFRKIDLKSIKVHNHLPNNYIIGNKKALFYTMYRYYEKVGEDTFQNLPLTFHIQSGLQDPEYLKFLNSYYGRAKSIRARQKKKNMNQESVEKQIQLQQIQSPLSPVSPSRISIQNMWIVKPGQFSNRGNGITVCMNLQQIKAILKKKQRHDNGNFKTYIIQSYIQKPFLYQRRKFDIRHYMMITSINGIIKGYWYELGYIRTTSFEYTIKNGFTSVHLTNDAVQKYLPEYGKYEKGNKVSYEDFEKYLEKEYGNRYSFYEQIYPKMKKIATDSMKACSLLIDPERKGHNFQIFGMDFMIDADFHPWLIEINNNPCLEISCPLLGEIIPPMVENALKISLDSIFPPPATMSSEKKPIFVENALELNKFELVYNSCTEEQRIKNIYNGNCDSDLDYKQLQKEEDEVFDDDGVEFDY